MANVAVIFDAFGTLLKISSETHPYLKILKLGIEQGRRPKPTDAESLLSMSLDLRQAADFFEISVDPHVMSRLESDLQQEVSSIRAFPDGVAAVEALQVAGVKVAVCSNLAQPYAAAIERLYPSLDGYTYSFAVGNIKPRFEIYRHALHLVSALPSETWMIGDSKKMDCDAPREIGIRGFYLNRKGDGGYTTLSQFAEDVLHTRSSLD